MTNLTTNQHEPARTRNSISNGKFVVLVWFVVNFFFFISCSEPSLPPLHLDKLPEGYGALSLRVTDNVNERTIAPNAPSLNDYAVYVLSFTATSGGSDVTVDRTNATLAAEPVILEAGTYSLTVSAYFDAGKTRLAAQGTLTNIAITAGANASALVQLKALVSIGTGTFEWSVNITADGVTMAAMTISQGGAALSGYPLVLSNTGTNSGEASLPSGIYNVSFHLVKDGADKEECIWNELLYVYSSLTSEYSKIFNDEYFYRTHYNIIFDHNYDGISEPQSVLHGDTITAPEPIRYGYHLNGWFTDAAALNAFDFSVPVINNITLYAGWIRSTASFTLNVAQIENGDPVFSTPIVVSPNGIGVPAAFNVSVANAGDYSHFKWEIAGVGVMPAVVVEGASASAFTINGAHPNYGTLGGHVLKLTVTRNGILYQVNIPFSIVYMIPIVTVSVNDVTTVYANLDAAFTAIGTTAGDYIVTLYEDQTLEAQTMNTAGQNITLVGDGGERTIEYNGADNARMFLLENAATSLTLGNNITIQGINGTTSLIRVDAGALTMENGSKVTGHTTTTNAGTISVVGANSRFDMNGGIITGNNSINVTNTSASGGIWISDLAAAAINGGSVSGNSPLDIYIDATAVFNLSGNVEIGSIILSSSVGFNAAFNLGLFSGTVETLNLRGNIPELIHVISFWVGKPVIQAASGYTLTAADIAKFPLGKFSSQTVGELQPISDTHMIGTSGADLGRLIVRPAVTVSANGGAAVNYATLAAAFTAIGTQAGDYTVTLLQNQTMTAGRTINTAGQHITIVGEGGIRTIDNSNFSISETMFTISNNTASLTLGNNITIQGRTTAGTGTVIINSNGTFRMLAGSKITGHQNSSTLMVSVAPVNINGPNSVFEMSGGSIENNNTTVPVTTTTVTGGVNFNNGTFTMTGGSITGNTQGAGNPSDVYHTNTTANSFTMSGNAAIGALKLNASSATASISVSIGAGWSGSINRLNLRSNIAAIETALEWWANKLLFSGGITSGHLANIALGDFMGSGGAAQPISPYVIGVTGDDLGRLIVPPIPITNEDDLRRVGTGQIHNGRTWLLTSQYLLMNNITLTSDWTRIGGATESTAFRGTFDGNGYTITGMTINDNANNQGMFGYVGLNSVVKNLRLADINITSGGINVGGIAGQNAGLILNCHVSGIINSTNTTTSSMDNNASNVGGIVGRNGQAGSGNYTVQGCFANVTITAAGGNVGGIVGSNSQVIRNCYSTGSIISTSTSTMANIGGIVGVSNIGNFSNVVITGCYSTMNITANGGNIGGIIGHPLSGTNLNSNLALNEFITTSASATTIGRISGTTSGTLSNNRAWQDMPVSSGSTYTRTATLIGKDGLDVTATDLKTQSPWTESVFPFGNNDDNPWVWEDGKMPRLYWETAAGVGSRDWPTWFVEPPTTVTVTVNSETTGYLNLAAAFTAIGTTAGNYTVRLLQDLPMTATRAISTANQHITIVGEGGMRVINGSTIAAATTMFTISNATASLTLGENITIRGRTATGSGLVVSITNGTFTMQPGSRITGHTTSSTTGSAVQITTNGTASFIMNGGSIEGNNNTTAATTTTAAGGVVVTAGSFTMNGGSITGNTQGTATEVTAGTAAASDVYHAVTTANSFTMSGNAAIGALKLNSTSTTAGATVVIGSDWSGSIGTLNLRGNIAAIGTAAGYWTGSTRTIFNGIAPAQVANIGLGEFISSDNSRQAISPSYFIGTSGNNLGRLLFDPAIAPVTVTANGATSGHLTLTEAFTAIGTQAGDFTITLKENQTLGVRTMNTANQHITLIGSGGERTIQYNGAAASVMLTLSAANANLTLDNDITINGINNGTRSLITVTNGILTMRGGSKITGHNTNSTDGVVIINGANAHLIMEGGTITGNNTTSTATETLASGGVLLNQGRITMTSGSITGNFHQRGTANETASDVFVTLIAATDSNTFTLSGSASIGSLKLGTAPNAVAFTSINISGAWTGNIGILHLRRNSPAVNDAVTAWTGRQILQAVPPYTLSASDISGITALGNFLSNVSTNAQAISDTHEINASGVLAAK